MEQSKKQELIKEFLELIDDEKTNENDIQRYLEEHSEMIPLPILLNHHLNFRSIISKLPLGREYKTDFAYLTKSSTGWNLVLIELESSHKKIFTKDKKNPKLTQAFNNARDQVNNWKAYVQKNYEKVRDSVKNLLQPINMRDNILEVKYVLIIGRSDNAKLSEKERELLQTEKQAGIEVMTYDSLINHFYLNQSNPKNILTQVQDHGFRMKYFAPEVSNNLLSYLTPDKLIISKEIKEQMKAEGYDIDNWEEGHLLSVNGRSVSWSNESNGNSYLAKLIDEFNATNSN